MSAIAIRNNILSWRSFDALLRGVTTIEERVRLLSSWIAWQILCASVFGLSLGVFALTARANSDFRFMLGAGIKMPLLLLLTSVVTCPSLYVFGTLRGLSFSAREFASMLMVAHTILAAVLGSLAPVVAFFALTTMSYSFMVLLTVIACAIAGFMGIRVFVKAINEPPLPGEIASPPETSEMSEPDNPHAVFARPRAVSKNVWQLLGWWVVLYIFVGTQMGWMLRPFIGAPDLEFSLFRGKGGSLVESVIHHVQHLLGN